MAAKAEKLEAECKALEEELNTLSSGLTTTAACSALIDRVEAEPDPFLAEYTGPPNPYVGESGGCNCAVQ